MSKDERSGAHADKTGAVRAATKPQRRYETGTCGRRGGALHDGEELVLRMEIDLIFKIAAVGILVAVLNTLLSRTGRDEQALMVTLAGLVCVLVMVVREISELFELIRRLFGL